MSEPHKSIAAHSVTSSIYNIISSTATLGLGFARAILLARLLIPAEIGLVKSVALFFVSLISQLTDFGFGRALIHRQTDIEQATATHFLLSLGAGGLKVIVALLAAPLLYVYYDVHVVHIVLALTGVGLVRAFTLTPSVLMTKNLDFRRLSVLDLLCSVSMTIVAPLMAWHGFGIWSLVGEQAAGVIVRTIGIWGFYRPWKPHWHLDWALIKWYFRFGIYIYMTKGLGFLLNQFDDFWAGSALGYTFGGLYSKAYEYARYPRLAVANPLMDVFFPTFAKVQDNREHLSKAFFRVSSLIVRAGFLFSGAFALIAPEFVRIFPGDNWLPMVTTFRLMLVYTLFDPLIVAAGNLATAVGQPQVMTRAKAAQLAMFVPLVVLLARHYPTLVTGAAQMLGLPAPQAQSIDGIAIAANIMLLLGIVLIFWSIRAFVDFSLRRMFGWPLVALSIALGTSLLLDRAITFSSDWTSLLGKAGLFATLYTGMLLLIERKDYVRYAQIIWSILHHRKETMK